MPFARIPRGLMNVSADEEAHAKYVTAARESVLVGSVGLSLRL